MADLISLTINGRTVRAPSGTTILKTARSAGVEIPTLCYHPNLTANGVCRLCVVEVVGAREPAAGLCCACGAGHGGQHRDGTRADGSPGDP